MESEDSTTYTIRPGFSLTGASQIDSGLQWTQLLFRDLETADSNSRIRFRLKAIETISGNQPQFPRIEVQMMLTADVQDQESFQSKIACYYVLNSLPEKAIREALENLIAIWDFHRESLPQVRRRELEMIPPIMATMGEEVMSPPFVLDASDE